MSRKELTETGTGFASPGGLLLYGLLGWCVVCDWSAQTDSVARVPEKGCTVACVGVQRSPKKGSRFTNVSVAGGR